MGIFQIDNRNIIFNMQLEILDDLMELIDLIVGNQHGRVDFGSGRFRPHGVPFSTSGYHRWASKHAPVIHGHHYYHYRELLDGVENSSLQKLVRKLKKNKKKKRRCY